MSLIIAQKKRRNFQKSQKSISIIWLKVFSEISSCDMQSEKKLTVAKRHRINLVHSTTKMYMRSEFSDFSAQPSSFPSHETIHERKKENHFSSFLASTRFDKKLKFLLICLADMIDDFYHDTSEAKFSI